MIKAVCHDGQPPAQCDPIPAGCLQLSITYSEYAFDTTATSINSGQRKIKKAGTPDSTAHVL